MKSMKYFHLTKGPLDSSQANFQLSSAISGPVSAMSVTMMDVILRSPMKILTTEPARSEFLAGSSLTERLGVAHQHLSGYYVMHLESLWPRNYRQVFSVLHSNWLRLNEARLALVERFRLKYFHNVATPPKAPLLWGGFHAQKESISGAYKRIFLLILCLVLILYGIFK